MNKRKDVHEYIELALDTGFSYIDTAQCNFKILNSRTRSFLKLIFYYEAYENEESIPIAIRESGLTRSDLYISTKYGGGDTGEVSDLEEAIRTSLNKVQYLTDLY